MTNLNLALSYFIKAKKRFKILNILLEENDYSDVIREAQELVELALKGMLRYVGIEPPKIHDVGPYLIEYKHLFSKEIQNEVEKLAFISKKLRKERELAFYGDIDFIPTESYTKEDAIQAIHDAQFVIQILEYFKI
ncbi:MAG: HEPN domain-containing protein [Leptonema sp. (in: bacteria)]